LYLSPVANTNFPENGVWEDAYEAYLNGQVYTTEPEPEPEIVVEVVE
jgi:hypothetical protein